MHEFPCAWQLVLRLPWLPLQLGAPSFDVSQACGCARGLSRYSGTVRVLSPSLTPSLSGRVAVRLRERRQWDNDFVLIVGGTDTSRHTGPQLVLFPVPHFRELRSKSIKVTGMGLRGVTYRCGGLVKCRFGPEMKQDQLQFSWSWRPGVVIDLLASSYVAAYCMILVA
ncbi:hypothetical protein Taro_043632 [Colocasia esculenta]|uniref:Uncharacterized protein n=1 Tax=Colocasia esculenta TaxID=4460 RepID=A0A843X1W7_COLES|nr:hypothetical protein [Colocasia esculenta]